MSTYIRDTSSVNLLKSSIVGNIGNSGSKGCSRNLFISVSSVVMDGSRGTIGIENEGGDNVLREGGKIPLAVLAASSFFCVFSVLSLLLLCVISSISAEQATSDCVTWEVTDVNYISTGSSWSSSVSAVSADFIVLETLLLLVTRSLARELGFGRGRGFKDPSLTKANLDDI